jgi:ribokinase
MAARLKASVAIICKVGQDRFGPMVRQNFEDQGIARAVVFEDKNLPSGVAPILVDDEGRNMVIIVPGANNTLTSAEVRQAEEVIQGAKILITQLEIPDEAILTAFEIAHASGVRIILNPAPARKVPDSMIAMSDLLVPNETEAELLTGLPVEGRQGASTAAKRLQAMGARTVIVTLGAEGALLWDGQREQHFTPPIVNAVDTTGSGDAFIGSLAYALAREKSIEDSIRFANVAAALSVTRIGTQISFPTLEEIRQLDANIL